jgi:phosphatidate cytidylyltransferase
VIVFVVLACWWEAMPSPEPPFSLVVVTMFVLGWLAFEVLNEGRTIQDAASDLVALVYVGLPLGMLVAIHARTGWKGTILLIATIVVSDSAQYYSGRAFGRRPLAPTISPKKTIEGALGGLVVGTLFVIVAGPFVFAATPLIVRAFVGVILVLAGICGDLFESRLKRLADMKDSSTLIPGHGGVLDRIDALLFAIPVFYFMVLQGRVA